MRGAFIVYCATVKAVEELAVHLQQEGIEAEIYHGRLAAKRRALAQERFMQGVVPIMVATNAFGLGIDKPDIRHVIHYQMPATLESFYQEFGRAGRDGQPSSGTLLYDREDAKLQRFLGSGKFPNDTDLVNAYHALRRLTEEGEHPTLSQVEAIAPLKKARLKACLDLFVQRRIATRDGRKRYCLVQTELDRDQLARASQSCAEREELAKVRQQSMVEYAEKPTCRWQQLLAYFDSDELPSGKCGHCDCCGSGTAPA